MDEAPRGTNKLRKPMSAEFEVGTGRKHARSVSIRQRLWARPESGTYWARIGDAGFCTLPCFNSLGSATMHRLDLARAVQASEHCRETVKGRS